MSEQMVKPTFKSFLSSALLFTFSDKKQLFFSLLSFLLPFLFFIPTLFIGLSVQSSFLVEYEARNPLVLDQQNSIRYNVVGGFSNTSSIPNDLLTQLDEDVATVISLSYLGQYIKGYQIFCRMDQLFYYDGSFYPLKILFLENNSFSQIAQFFNIQNEFPQTINEVVFLYKSDAPYEELYLNAFSLGNVTSIFPQTYEPEQFIENGTFIFTPLNATISNIFNVNDLFLDGIFKDDFPFIYRILIQHLSETNFPHLLLPINLFNDYVHYFSTLLQSDVQLSVQFNYDFSNFHVKDLKKISQYANALPDLSGYSESYKLYAYVSSELSDFLVRFRQEIQLQWFRLFALSFPAVIFSLFILWLSFSSNTLKLSDIYANFLSKGFPPRIILRIFAFSRFIELGLSFLLGLLLAVPISYASLSIIAVILKTTPLPLNLISAGAVILPSLVFFLFLFGYSFINQIFLIKKVEQFFPERLSSFRAVTGGSLKSQLLVSGLILLFSSIGIAVMFILRSLVIVQAVLLPEILFVFDVFLYIFILCGILSFLYILVNFLLQQLIKQAHFLWKKASHKFSINLHNLSLTFQHHKKQSLFLVLSLIIFLQSFFVPAYLSHHAAISAQFQLGSDVSIHLVNSSEVSSLLSNISTNQDVLSIANYTLFQISIFSKNYQVLAVSPSFTSTVFYSRELTLGFSRTELSDFCSAKNSLLTQSDDRFLNNRINLQTQKITLGFNNNSDDNKLISIPFNVSGSFHLFPILFNDYLFSFVDPPRTFVPFLVLSESAYKDILAYKESIDISTIDEAFLVKLKKQSTISAFVETVQNLPIETSVRSYLDDYQSFLPTFCTSILALSIISGLFAAISFFLVSTILVNDLLLSRREKILVLRYRGLSVKKISRDFLSEYLLVLLLMIPLGVGGALGLLFYLLRVLVKAEIWILVIPHYYSFTIYISIIITGIILLDCIIRNIIQRRFLIFQPSIMEGT